MSLETVVKIPAVGFDLGIKFGAAR